MMPRTKFNYILLIFTAVLSTFANPGKCYSLVHAYISNNGDNTVSVIDTSDNTVGTPITVGNSPFGIAFAPSGDIFYVTNNFDNTISIVNAYSGTVETTLSTDMEPVGVAVSTDGSYAYVANSASGTLTVIDTSDYSTETISVGTNPYGVAVSPDDNTIYVTDATENKIYLIDRDSNSVTDTIDVGNGPLGVAASPDGQYVVTANSNDNTVSVITTETSAVTNYYVDLSPFGVVITSDSGFAYITNTSSNTVSVISLTGFSVNSIDVGTGPKGISITPDETSVYVVNQSDNTASVIETENNIVTATINIGTSPVGFGRFIGIIPPQSPTDLVATLTSDTGITLTWTDNSTFESGFKIERKKYSTGTFAEVATEGPDITTYTDTGLDHYTRYYYRVRAYDADGNSSYSNEVYVNTKPEDIFCFIATAAYGSSLTKEVNILKEFRDNILLTNSIGRAFVKFYYNVSPPIADFISNHDNVRTIVRLSLLPLIGLSWTILKIGAVNCFVLLAIIISGICSLIAVRSRFRKA